MVDVVNDAVDDIAVIIVLFVVIVAIAMGVGK